MSTEISAETVENKALSYSYYVVYNFVKEGQGGAGSKVYHTNCGLTDALIGEMYHNIKESEDFETVIILNVVKLDGKDAPVYPH